MGSHRWSVAHLLPALLRGLLIVQNRGSERLRDLLGSHIPGWWGLSWGLRDSCPSPKDSASPSG